ncbi:MAG: hypothetical protein AB7C89_02490 [Intestinibacillus sp.]
MKRKRNWGEIPLVVVMVGLLVLVLAFVQTGVRNAGETADEEGLRIAEQSIRRAAVSCYAIEGQYPPSYTYIKEGYGVRVNESLYAVHYEVFASNLMPEITVVERTGS